jgi:ABC-type branched-subunit amino acid transport system ATPase component/ABC-type branched-subunit amino acid transport system permease subunit
MSEIYAVAVVGISLGILTGLGGQVSLGQFAIAAVGGVVAYKVMSHGGNAVLAYVAAGVVGSAVLALIALPALKVKGLMLTVTTLAFAVMAPEWLLAQPWMMGGGKGGVTAGINPVPPAPFGHPLNTGRKYYFLALFVLVAALWLARNIRKAGFGRLLIAVRDNENGARAFSIRAGMVTFQGILVAGFVAGIGGALYTGSFSRVTPSTFPATMSISVVVMLIIGGMEVVPGPLLGALVVIGIPTFITLDSAGLAANSLGQLMIILFLPAGLAQVAEPLRDRLVKFFGRRAGIDVEAAYSGMRAEGELSADRARQLLAARPLGDGRVTAGSVLLAAEGLTKSYGGVRAVSEVAVTVRAGEIVGLIGANGAGKTTLFELLSGFTEPDAGRVVFDGHDVSGLGPEARGRRGLVRSFQDSALFPTLTVEETVMLALERLHRTRLLTSTVGWSRVEKRRRAEAATILTALGLDAYRTRQIQECSTATRRLTEIACMITMQPTLLLLDEPSSGIAQRETDVLGDLLVAVKERLNVTLFVIEHDVPLIMGISDRIVAMANGQVIGVGTPDEVRRDPLVVESYLGANLPAVTAATTAGPQIATAAGGDG